MVFRRKYATAATLHGIPLVTRGESDYKANPTLAAGDVKVSKDGGAFTNIATLPDAHPASGRSLRVQLSSSEATAARVVIQFVDQTSPKEWEDQFVIVETFGDASAQDEGSVTTVQQILEGDETIDTAQTPWEQVIKAKGTATELVRKALRTAASGNVTSEEDIVGRREEPS